MTALGTNGIPVATALNGKVRDNGSLLARIDWLKSQTLVGNVVVSARHTSSSALFLGACQLIALKFGDPELTPDELARELGVSSRTLARVFAANHETVMRRVFDERLRQAARLLTAPEAAHRSVTDIAFACGFNDVSHFGRMFAARMHMTPSRWRRRRP